MGWYDDLTPRDVFIAKSSAAGLAVVHTSPFAEDSGQRWVLFDYMDVISERVQPILFHGGKAMVFMPPRHGKSLYSSVYAAAWFIMFHGTRNVILTSYSGDLCAGFSRDARNVVRDLGHLFGCRVHPDRHASDNWQIQIADGLGGWRDGGKVFAAGVDGPLPGRGGHLIVMDDVVRGHRDTTSLLMEKAYNWYRAVLETRLEPGAAMLLVMTRWAQADLAGRLLEDEGDEWDLTVLPALAKDDDPLGRKPGEALCPDRYSREWLEKKRDSSDEGGIIFSALYQQEPLPEGGLIFKASDMQHWEGVDGSIRMGNDTWPRGMLLLPFATIDPALKEKELNDPTGFLVWALSPRGALLLMEDHTRRMAGSDDLIPLMLRVWDDWPGIQFFVEDQAHGTEVIRACERERLPVLPLKADRDKVTRWIGAQPAFAARKVWLPKVGGEAVQRELLENPGGKHDDRVDCVAYAVQVWRDRCRQIDAGRPLIAKEKLPPAEIHNVHPADRPEILDAGKDHAGRWRP